MNKTLYNSAVDSITMSEDCERKILEMAEKTETSEEASPRRIKFRMIPLLAAAAVLVTCTITASAGGFDWIKGFFPGNSDMEITDDVTRLVAKVDKFECESNCGIEISPVGVIADDYSLYFMMKVESLPEDVDMELLDFNKFYTDSLPADERQGFPKYLELGTRKGDYGETEIIDDNMIIFTASADRGEKVFFDGDRIHLRIGETRRFEGEDGSVGWCENAFGQDLEKYADISFNISINPRAYIEKEFNEYTMVHIHDRKMFVEKLTVSPLKVIISGHNIVCYDRSKNCDLVMVMKDGTEIRSGWSSGSGSLDMAEMQYRLDTPIDPEKVEKLYIGDKCLYDRSED